MPKLTAEKTRTPIKLLLMAYSGEGKSTAIVPLSIPEYRGNPGYELRWLDFDGKAEEVVRANLLSLLKNKKITQEQHDAALSNNDIALCTENTGVVSVSENKKTTKKFGTVGSAKAWTKAVKQMETWERSWSDQNILVVDSFTYAVRGIVNYLQELNGRLNQELRWQEFNAPQQMAETLMVMCADIPTNVIVTAHQDPLELYKATDQVDEKGKQIEELVDTLMVPISIGRAGRMKLPARFNHTLVISSEGSNAGTKRWLYTEPHVGVVTKTPFFAMADRRYPMETGLVDYFKLRD